MVYYTQYQSRIKFLYYLFKNFCLDFLVCSYLPEYTEYLYLNHMFSLAFFSCYVTWGISEREEKFPIYSEFLQNNIRKLFIRGQTLRNVKSIQYRNTLINTQRNFRIYCFRNLFLMRCRYVTK